MRLMVTQEILQIPDGREVPRGHILTLEEQALLENPTHDEQTGISTNHSHLLRGVVQVSDDHPIAQAESQAKVGDAKSVAPTLSSVNLSSSAEHE